MAAITPSTNLKLLKNPNNLSNQNQLTFANATAQYNYFNGLTKLEVDDFTYQRKDYVIRYNACIDDILDYNYVMYQNEAYDNKWFYAYIENMRWINDHVTEITIKTDVFQTFQFDLTYKASFVEREHVNDDTIGKHTIPENLEYGEYITQSGTETVLQTGPLFYLTNTYVVVGMSEPIPNYVVQNYPNGKVFNGVYSALYYIVLKTPHDVDNFIRGIQSEVTEDIIYSVFLIPKDLVTLGQNDWGTYTLGSYSFEAAYYPYNSTSTKIGEVGFNKETYLDSDYVPTNKKLLCFPYRYLLISNNAGQAQEYHYELFSGNTCEFVIKGCVSPGCSIKLMPSNYAKGYRIEGIDGGKLPTCSWYSDSYTNWLTQNAVNIPLDAIRNIGLIGGGLALAAFTGGTSALAGLGAAATGIMGVGESMRTIYEHSLTPNTAKGGVNQGDLNFAENAPFSYYKMTIKKEYAEIIDKFFSMYGYKVNTVKVPNITGRTNWNYVKTIGANIEGLIPEFYLNEIKSLFDAGITLWHTTQYFLDYSRSNTIVS